VIDDSDRHLGIPSITVMFRLRRTDYSDNRTDGSDGYTLMPGTRLRLKACCADSRRHLQFTVAFVEKRNGPVHKWNEDPRLTGGISYPGCEKTINDYRQTKRISKPRNDQRLY